MFHYPPTLCAIVCCLTYRHGLVGKLRLIVIVTLLVGLVPLLLPRHTTVYHHHHHTTTPPFPHQLIGDCLPVAFVATLPPLLLPFPGSFPLVVTFPPLHTPPPSTVITCPFTVPCSSPGWTGLVWLRVPLAAFYPFCGRTGWVVAVPHLCPGTLLPSLAFPFTPVGYHTTHTFYPTHTHTHHICPTTCTFVPLCPTLRLVPTPFAFGSQFCLYYPTLPFPHPLPLPYYLWLDFGSFLGFSSPYLPCHPTGYLVVVVWFLLPQLPTVSLYCRMPYPTRSPLRCLPFPSPLPGPVVIGHVGLPFPFIAVLLLPPPFPYLGSHYPTHRP